MNSYWYWFNAVLATEAITEILVASELFDGLRRSIAQLAYPIDEPTNGPQPGWVWLNKLTTCGYCMSVWVAAGVVWFLPGDYFGIVDNVIVKGFALHRLSNWLHVTYELVRRGRARTYDIELKLLEDTTNGPGTSLGETSETSRSKDI